MNGRGGGKSNARRRKQITRGARTAQWVAAEAGIAPLRSRRDGFERDGVRRIGQPSWPGEGFFSGIWPRVMRWRVDRYQGKAMIHIRKQPMVTTSGFISPVR